MNSFIKDIALLPECSPSAIEFYVTVLSSDVSMPDWLLARYPHKITFILKKKYADLEIGNGMVSFSVAFDGVWKTISFPVNAVIEYVTSRHAVSNENNIVCFSEYKKSRGL